MRSVFPLNLAGNARTDWQHFGIGGTKKHFMLRRMPRHWASCRDLWRDGVSVSAEEILLRMFETRQKWRRTEAEYSNGQGRHEKTASLERMSECHVALVVIYFWGHAQSSSYIVSIRPVCTARPDGAAEINIKRWGTESRSSACCGEVYGTARSILGRVELPRGLLSSL